MVGWRKIFARARGAAPTAPVKALLAAAAVALSVVSAASFALSAQVAHPAEAELKAAFLYNFIKFTEWPAAELANKSEPFVIGVLGKDPFGAILEKTIEGETFHQKPIAIRRFSRMDDSVADSHVLFIGASEESYLPAILKLLDGQAILTVSEIENFGERGGIIKLKKENNKIAFDINVEAARRARLALHAQLLKLAKIVKTQS